MGALEPGRNTGEVFLSVSDRRSGREPAEHQHRVRLTRQVHRIQNERRPDVHAAARVAIRKAAGVIGSLQPLKDPDIGAPRHDSHDGADPVVQFQRGTNGAARGEQPAGQPFADQHLPGRAAVLLVSECAALHRMNSESGQQPIGHEEAGNPNRLGARRREGELRGDDARQRVEPLRLLPEVEQVGDRCRFSHSTAVPVGLPYCN